MEKGATGWSEEGRRALLGLSHGVRERERQRARGSEGRERARESEAERLGFSISTSVGEVESM